MALTDRVRIVSIPTGETSLTSASVSGLTPTLLANYSLVEHNKAKLIAMAREAREIGVIGKSLGDLMLSRITEIGKDRIQYSRLPGLQSQILPFVYRTRKARIGNPQFTIASGGVNANAGNTVSGIAYPSSAWDIVVNVGPGYVSDVADLHRYFLPSSFCYCESINQSTSAKTVTPFKIITASTTGGVTTVTVAANRTDTEWGTMTSDEKLPYQPEFGTVFLGGNNVGDYESWAYNEPVNLSKSLVVSWIQTSRYTQITNDVYETVLKSIISGQVNDMASSFDYLSYAEQNKQMAMHFERKMLHDIWFGSPIDERQSDPNNYTTLEPELDPLDGVTVYGYKTRALGIRTLLANENRVFDFAGGAIYLNQILDECYNIYRTRQASGDNAQVIDLMTDRQTSNLLRRAFRAIQKDAYGTSDSFYYKPGQVLEGTRVQYSYEKYSLPELPFDIAVFTSTEMDDRIAAFGDGTGGLNGSVNLKNSARAIWAIDWSDIEIPIVATNQATREFGGKTAADVLASLSKVIKLNPKKYMLRSTTFTVELGDEARHALWENYSLSTPIYDALGDSVDYS